jgi:nucleoside-diphosphate-sugar epimerase
VRYVIVDCGPVGQELARRWTAAGNRVLGTTADPAELARVAAVCTEAIVLSHAEADRIREVAADADGTVLATRPRLLGTQPPRERVTAYRQHMISVVRAASAVQRRLVLFSSIAVYGGGGPAAGPVTEATPVTRSLDPAAQSFAAVERMVLEWPEAAVLRFPETVTGPGDPATGQTHAIDYRDAAAAAAFVMERGLAGVYNAVPEPASPTARPVSSAKLRAAGFSFAFAPGGPA